MVPATVWAVEEVMSGKMRLVFASVVFAVCVGSVAAHAEGRREVEARALFAKGDYQAALDIYAHLFAEKADPIYLRNIGRCYQKLQQPDKSIDAFREYLRRGHVKAAERTEIEGFIREMEELQNERAAAAPPPEPVHPIAVPDSSPPPAPAPAVTDTVSPSNSAPGAMLTQEGAPAEPSTPITHRWWFWTGIAVLVAGGAATAFVLARPHAGAVPPCTASECQ
jgi:hypothetical protein